MLANPNNTQKNSNRFFTFFISAILSFSFVSGQDECFGLSQGECVDTEGCEWMVVANPLGVLEMCIFVDSWNDDGGWEDECFGLSQDECVDTEGCEWSDGSQSDNNTNAPIGVCHRNGDWNDDGGGWEDECSGLSYYECAATEGCEWSHSDDSTANGFCHRASDWNDDGGWPVGCSGLSQEDCDWLDYCEWQWGNSTTEEGSCVESNINHFECTDLGYEQCLAHPECEPIYNAAGQFEGCLEGNDDGPPECILDCEGISDLAPDSDPNALCEFFVSINGSECLADCGEEDIMGIAYISEICSECLEDETIDCADVIGGGGDDGGWDGECSDLNQEDCEFIDACEWISGSDNSTVSGMCVEAGGGDDELPECLLDCPGLENLVDQDPDSLCRWIIEINGTYCYEDCDDDLVLGIPYLADACTECLENEDLDCADVFDEEDCDPDLMCAQVETCVDGLLYPTSCGPDNCDEPIGECNGGGNDGVLYGYVEYIWGDAIEMVGGAHILIQSVNSNSPNIGIHETYTNDSGSYEIALPPGAYMVTASAYEDSETHDVYIQSGHEHELNFSLGEWGWPEPQAIFSLGDGIGTQEGFTVPLYLQTDTPASGLQFAVLPEYTGGGFWFTPSELESTNDCFSASFNDVYSQLWGIMFSLEGCVYEPGEHHVANLSFTVATGSIVPPGTDVQLAFNYTLVSNPDGLEIPSSGQGSTVTFGSPGDVNSDGEVNVLDIVAAVNFILLISEPTDHQYWATDVNEDGHINVLDIVIMVNMILYPDDMGRLDGKAHLMFSPDRILINGENVAGIQLTFSDNVVLESTSLPKGWILKTYGNTIISYRQNGDILYGQTEFNLGSDSELVDYVIADAGGNCITVSKTELPQTVALLPNYPNPFNPETTLSYTLSSEDMVNISVYDITGKLIQTLVNEVQLIGTHQITWHANDLPSGMYISLLSVAGETYTRKIMLMK